ncbi:MAG: FAD:protein FMN transferase [Muribaculaceae bacterium]|nr:FAD:protein FMN transferase [Muribaculaceae bacterium]
MTKLNQWLASVAARRSARAGLIASVALIALMSQIGCKEAGPVFRQADGEVWTTRYRVVYRAAGPLEDSIVAELDAVDRSLSMFNPNSVVSMVNSNQSMAVDSAFADVFRIARRVWQLSGGSYDPTVAPLVDLWGFGRRGCDSVAPSSLRLREALKSVGMGECYISDGTVVKKNGATEFDFSSIAKGYAVDRIAGMLRRNGVDDYLVEIGGEVAAGGVNCEGRLWAVGIENASDLSMTDEMLLLENMAVATSGNYRRYVELLRAGHTEEYGHIIDPRSGFPRKGSVASATVVAPTCALADALATACFVMSPTECRALEDSIEGVRIILNPLAPQ